MIDTSNEDPKYWEKVLAENDLPEERGDPEPIAITPTQFEHLLDEAIQEEEDNVKTRFMPRTFAEEYENVNAELRTKFDSNDSFITGHQIVRSRKARKDKKSQDIFRTDEGIKSFLLSVFPKLNSNIKQRSLAGRWARVIYLYYRANLTTGQISKELNLTYRVMWRIIQRIQTAANNPKRTHRGRPKKAVVSEPLVGRD